MPGRYCVTDTHREKIRDILPGRAETVGVTAGNNRRFVNAVISGYRTEIPWRDLPERFGNWKVVHLRHTRRAKKGVRKKIFNALSEDADYEYAAIAGTIVKAHQHSAGARGRNKKKNVSAGRRED